MPSQPQPRPAATFEPGYPRALGDKYTLVRQIGRGGMAAVHLAVSAGIGAHRTCAVKTVAYRPGERDGELLSKRFLEEAAAVTKLSHENLVFVFDAGVVERQLFLAMEYIEGKTLADVMAWSRARQESLPLNLALFVAMEILHGLAHVHGHRLIHRDVSPSNVVISASGTIKVLDFGLARSVDTSKQTGMGMKLGKAGYAAPEQLLGGDVDERSDLFSVGVILWELLAGQALLSVEGVRARNFAFESPARFNPKAPRELDETLRLALADSPEDRFATAEEFAEELARYLAPDDHRKQLRQFVELHFGNEIQERRRQDKELLSDIASHSSAAAPDARSLGPMVSPTDYIGTVLDGRYELVRLIGTGSMGAVYEAQHKGIGRKVAVKIPFLHGDANMKARFIREARATNRINDPHVVDITDAGETPQGDAYVVMDFLEGRDLEKWNHERKLWPPDEAVDVAVQIARGLEAAHEAGVVHRDLKPSNVMLVETRQGPVAKVLDFGVAKLLAHDTEVPIDGLTRADTALGTPRYMAPEQMIEGRSVDGRADVYSAAVILYEMLSGKAPHEAEDVSALCHAKVNTPAAPLDHLALRVPGGLNTLIMEALNVDPALRPSSASAWRSRLETLRPERRRSGSGSTTVPANRPNEKASGTRLAVPLLLLGLGVVVVAVAWKSGRPLVPVGPATPVPPITAPPQPSPVISADPPPPAPAPAAQPVEVHEAAPDPAAVAPKMTAKNPAAADPPPAPPGAPEGHETELLEAAEQSLVSGDFAAAARSALKALSVAKSARAYAMLARVHMAQGENKAASAVVQEGVQRYPDDRVLAKLAERLK